MLDQWGIARPSLHAFVFLHKLGETQLQAGDGPVLATKRADGSLAMLVWNLIPAKDANALANGNPVAATAGAAHGGGTELTLNLRLSGLGGRKQVKVSRVGGDIGTAIPAWKTMGSPKYPTPDEIKHLRAAAELPAPETHAVAAGEPSRFAITVPANSVALLEFAK